MNVMETQNRLAVSKVSHLNYVKKKKKKRI